ncbi:RsmB/NOP family class I SAM-dependent RNA methyltransferase [Paenibacillus caui]|uniref:RsmB/NOP family class I SAM-dependent RNA methyltransferase n=1 Tax=Paenibacillus caui TaxID=2873927 RepID=UPI001CA95999|nr:RsmB/NOP family class I SAM-dependent RNA methyltransferase [Paenibacillus caui]
MAVSLPPLFLARMQTLLGSEYPAYLASYEQPRFAGVRVNTLKIAPEAFLERTPFDLQPVPWCDTGFYIEEGLKPGKHPYYHAGLYYIQEPSAMAPVEALDVKPGDRVLDLCAAPGGKSTQIAAKLQGRGVLVTNDISEQRTKALAKNIELYGVRNAVVLNETPERIRNAFPGYFSKILIDAPCSGEGMFRKDADMAREWAKHSVEKCSMMQRDILQTAAGLLAPGGTIVYSTCTFAPEENEGQIAAFLSRHPEFEVVPLPKEWDISRGRPEWLEVSAPERSEAEECSREAAAKTAETGRLWPHLIKGEGHFVAVLRHTGRPLPEQDEREVLATVMASAGREGAPIQAAKRKAGKSKPGSNNLKAVSRNGANGADSSAMIESWHAFASAHLEKGTIHEAQPVLFGSHVYLSPLHPARLNGLRTIRPGWYAGTVKNGRFTPGHPLAAALKPEEALRWLNLYAEDGEAVKYLKGDTLQIPADRLVLRGCDPKGYVLVGVDGYSLGWGKWQDGMLKNEYPAGWRWT